MSRQRAWENLLLRYVRGQIAEGFHSNSAALPVGYAESNWHWLLPCGVTSGSVNHADARSGTGAVGLLRSCSPEACALWLELPGPPPSAGQARSVRRYLYVCAARGVAFMHAGMVTASWRYQRCANSRCGGPPAPGPAEPVRAGT
jgi:hypothetical protein